MIEKALALGTAAIRGLGVDPVTLVCRSEKCVGQCAGGCAGHLADGVARAGLIAGFVAIPALVGLLVYMRYRKTQ